MAKIVSVGFKSMDLIYDVTDNEELDDDVALCELLRVNCIYTVKALNDLKEYYSVFVEILDQQDVTPEQFKRFESGVNVLIDTFEKSKQIVCFNQHFINPSDLICLKIEDNFSPRLAEDTFAHLYKSRFPNAKMP